MPRSSCFRLQGPPKMICFVNLVGSSCCNFIPISWKQVATPEGNLLVLDYIFASAVD
jgi:hypothetical protein